MLRKVRTWTTNNLGLREGSSVREGGIALADQLIASATNFLTGVIVGRACTQEGFGLYMLGLSVVLLAMRLQNSLISTPYMVYSPRFRDDERARYTGSSLVHQAAISLICFLILALSTVASYNGIGPDGLFPVFLALTLTLTFILLREYVRNICFAQLDFLTAFVLDVCVAVAQLGGLLYLATTGLLSVQATFLVVGAGCGIAVAAWFVRTRSAITFELGRVIFDFQQNWDFGKWIFASGFLWEASVYLYPWILTSLHGAASTGVWAACFGAVAIVNPIMLGMSNYLGPKIAHSYAKGGILELRSYVRISSRVFFLFVAPFAFFLLIFGGELVVLFYGEKYAGYELVVSILAIDLLTRPILFALSRALFAMERAALDFATNFVPLFVLFVLGIWLVRTNSTEGVAYGILIGNIASVLAKQAAFFVANRDLR